MKLFFLDRPRHRLLLPIALVGGVLASVPLVVWLVTARGERANDPSTAPASDRSAAIPERVAASGFIEPREGTISIAAPTFSDGIPRVQKLLVKEGDRVEAGQPIAILDNRERLAKALDQYRSQAEVALARFNQVRAGAKRGTIQAQGARFQQVIAELEGQITTRRFLIASLRNQQKGESLSQRATIERIQAQLKNARVDCERYRDLHRDGAVSTQEQERICLQSKTLEKSLQEAESILVMRQGILQSNIQEARAELTKEIDTLEKRLQEENANFQAVAEVRPVDVEVALAEWKAAESAVARARADLDTSTARAPVTGRILKIYSWPGEKISSEGIVEIGQTDRMYVRAEVYETDIARVHVGQKAIVKLDSSARDLQGTVDEIGFKIGRKNVLNTDPVADTDARVVEVKIRLVPESSQRVERLTNSRVNVIILSEKNGS